MGVSLLWGRKPSLVGSVLDPRWPRGVLGGGGFWPAVVQKDGGEGGEEGEGAGLCVPVSSVCMDLNECVSVCFPFERRI